MSQPVDDEPLTPRSLPRRLAALLPLVGQVGTLADIGTDHALLPAHAVLRGVCERAIAIDLRDAPLVSARANLSLLGVADRVTLRRGDGLAALANDRVDAVVLAGLGGRTFLDWMAAAPEVVRSIGRIVVQPNGQLAEIRAWARASGLWLLDESVCRAHGRFFVSCAFAPREGTDPAYTDLDASHAHELGPWLVRRRDPLTLALYTAQRARLDRLVRAGRTEHTSLRDAYAACLVGA